MTANKKGNAMSDTPVLLKENLLRDVEELCRELDEPFTDEDVTSNTYGLDLMGAAIYFTEQYNKPGDFMTSVKSKLMLYKRLTPAQARVVLNILRQEVRGESKPVKERSQAQQCFICKEEFPSMTLLLDHKEQRHGKGKPKTQTDQAGEEFAPQRVIADTSSKLQLDISSLPNGRYAAPDLTGKHDYVFLMIRRTPKRILRDKRYTYGKIITGREWVDAGTIEVKEWSSDSKRLCGEQRPGTGMYEGEFEIQLNAIKSSPEPWARLFGTNIGRCGICGKTLTDEISRSDGFGPECIKKINEHYFTRAQVERFKRQYDSNVGRERVYCLEHKTYDCNERHNFYDLDEEVE